MEITGRELVVMEIVFSSMEDYMDGFSDVFYDDLVNELVGREGFATQANLKGVISSLESKDLIYIENVNGEGIYQYTITSTGMDAYCEYKGIPRVDYV